LFDEVEKAHVSVLTALLQVMDDGRLTDGKGRTVDFSNTVIILTSNLGAAALLEGAEKNIDFGPDSEGWEEASEKVVGAVKKKFPPELINRLDDMLIFSTIGRSDLINIVDLLIGNVEDRLKEAQATRETPLDINIILDPRARDHVVDTAYEPAFGVRPLRRYIEREIVTSLATAMVKGELGDDNVRF
jgi:ATP-dependent Clp protease ATP-binding subunit ClpB